MSQGFTRLKPFHLLLWLIVATIIAADQLSKAYFVYLLGSQSPPGFAAFAGEYFSLWSDGAAGSILGSHFGPYKAGIVVWEPWIRFNLTTNTGAAWSIFKGNSFTLSFVSLGMAFLLFIVWWRSFRYKADMTWALGAIIGGALGNFLDRFRLREVVDFVDVKIPWIGALFPKLGDPYDFPIFNVADACAVCGTFALAGYLIFVDVRALRLSRQQKKAPPPIEPFPEGPQLDEEAVAKLKERADELRERMQRNSPTASNEGSAGVPPAMGSAALRGGDLTRWRARSPAPPDAHPTQDSRQGSVPAGEQAEIEGRRKDGENGS